MSLETWIGLRYLRARKRSASISLISAFSMTGITVGVAVLISAMSLMSGFQKEIRNQLLNVAPHVELGRRDFEKQENWQALRKAVAGRKEIAAGAPVVVGQALLANAGEVRGVQIRGILPEEEKKIVAYGNDAQADFDNLKAGESDIILGAALAEELGAEKGSQISVMVSGSPQDKPETEAQAEPQTGQGSDGLEAASQAETDADGSEAESPSAAATALHRFNVVGIVKTGVYELDKTLAVTHLQDAQTLYGFGDGAVALRLKLADPQTASALSQSLLEAHPDLWIVDWTETNHDFFQNVELQKRMMFIILMLIVAVAAFNLISSLAMTVTEKQAAIAILRTLGLPPSGIMKIFVVQGALTGFFGTLFGVIIGLLISWNISPIADFFEQITGRKLIQSQVYFIDHLPSEVNFTDVATVVAVSLLLSFLATLYPSWRASKTQPAEALRYE
ncbi:ABC transporter permease [Neisseria chenwenguii]|uniref:Lipoprotein-releasing system transmembrane subunit LolC n=1 Tax=Neisseria chenwenguii TaxID=1853278 RepID=A0A220S4M4_9NEIS|nr:ABC transporter permease [Neisseria chenwenguii]ASK28293.1 lipoprotein-releasing system transmembrane subunit LolC [Neisseria chenwenguii]ROV52189.1 ABC transporter permease [Neisseria chenwenguii]